MESTKAKEQQPLILNATQAAKALGVSRPTLYEILNRGEIRSFYLGRNRMIAVESLKAWVAEQVQKAG